MTSVAPTATEPSAPVHAAAAVIGEHPLTRLLRRTVGPLLLLLGAPPFVMLLWFTHVHLGGSIAALGALMAEQGVLTTIAEAWGPVALGSPAAWSMIAGFAALQLALMRLLPGATVYGPPTPTGHVPVYKANGVASFLVTLGLFGGGAWLGWFSPAAIHDHFGELLGALNLAGAVLCVGLYFKGRFWPSGADAGVSGNPIFDYYWGTELYPRVRGGDVKMFTNCRMAMMGWPILVLSFAAKQHELHGLTDGMIVAVGLQLVYVFKFFRWEPGYLRSLDIMHDRAGFYICWGVLAWLPGVYTAGTLYLVNNPVTLGWPLGTALAVVGSAAIAANYLADRQRQEVRASGGTSTVWGRPPVLIRARSRGTDGRERESLLLASGYWGIARHFHYVPEILGALCWTLPALFASVLPYFYVIYLTILLWDRAIRDDKRCAAKYGAYWDEYRARVRWRVLPGVF
jgi:7-dehydrocholesterol reductase